MAAVSYVALLWLSIIVWVTRDSIQRSNSLIFQTFSILLNIAVPILGVLLYLIIRPSKTNTERYYEDIEHQMLTESTGDKETCQKCMTSINADYIFCPNCGEKMKKVCSKCKKSFPCLWDICPYCGDEQKEEKKEHRDHKDHKGKMKRG